jgi:glycosyltransferase involved in cell wall biosynthesis
MTGQKVVLETIVPKQQQSNFSSSLSPISAPYLLVLCITSFRDSRGFHYVDRLWYKDLIEHVRYLKHFTLAAPCKQANPPEGTVCLEEEAVFSGMRFVDLPAPDSFVEAVQQLPATIAQLWQEIGQATVVHSGVAGWPIPPAWLVTPLLLLRKRFYLIVVESAFWRLEPGAAHSLKNRVRSSVTEGLNRWCMNKTDLAIFSQPEWRDSLLTSAQTRSMIIHCSWIDEPIILSDAEAQTLWQQKIGPQCDQLRLILVGRLEVFKGVRVLLQALEILSRENVPVQLDIVGLGPLYDECVEASQRLRGSVEINILGSVTYGPELFTLLRTHHALVAPNLSEEVTRIVYDSYSQALPVLASSTNGLLECVPADETGRHYAVNDPVALANTVKWAWENLDRLEAMGMNSLQVARSLTHQEMHRKRWQALQEMLGQPDGAEPGLTGA